MEKENKGRTLQGTITSDKMDKTVVVTVSRDKKHSLYHKYFKQSVKFKAHDEGNVYKEGDEVVIEETRPLSKDKHWKVVGLVKKAQVKEVEIEDPQV
ncbi:MAG: 30S ribosomal protein S17 [bacterium]|nr:30S ribosomal protein S17 [bacterium]MDZ4231358.1 30S ribosomal protein S17 [Patescibacteria group bacterium]